MSNRIQRTLRKHLSNETEVSFSNEVRFDCPECDDSRHRFYFNLKKRIGYCQNCGYAPTLHTLLKDLNADMDAVGAAPTLEEIQETLTSLIEVPELGVIPMPAESIPITDVPEAVSYLLARGLTWEQIQFYGFRYCAVGIYKFRVIVPCPFGGENRGFVARSISPMVKIKYLYPNEMEKNRILWNFDEASRYPEVVLTEGVFDAIAVGPDAVATFGKTLSATQKRILLSANIKSLVLLWDSDAAQEIAETAGDLCGQIPTRVVFLDGADPGDTPREILRRLIREAPPWNPTDTFSHQLAQGFAKRRKSPKYR